MHALFIIGTRPEAIKLSEPIKRFQASGSEPEIRFTGQHPTLAGDTLKQLGVKCQTYGPPDDGERDWQDHIKNFLENISKKDTVAVVQGDTDSAMLSAIHAHRLGMKVVHVEAGLRTYADEPFPEESNRRVIGQIADVNCCPSWLAAENLRNERAPGRILVTGQTGLDVFPKKTVGPRPWELKPSDAYEIVVTLHRHETRPHLDRIAHQIEILAREKYGSVVLRVILHPNPAASSPFRERLTESPYLTMHGPLTFQQMGYAIRTANLFVTDSGGVQEERAFCGRPSLVLRKTTERPETSQWCKLADPAHVNLMKHLDANDPEER